MTWRSLMKKLLAEFAELPPSASTKALLSSLQSWLCQSLSVLNPQLVKRWGLGIFTDLALDDYPLLQADFDASEEIRRFLAVPPGTEDMLLMRVRDLFWSGTTVESEVECPNCESSVLRGLRDHDKEQLILACDLCSWAETMEGEPVKEERRLEPPTLLELDEFSGR